ncbi:MAG: urease subunit beta [Actinomycetota bacterium]
MYLTPTEEERLRVFAAAELARRTLERGIKLNAPECVALVCDAMHMAARAGATFEEVVAAGRRAVRRVDLLDGVPDIVQEIRTEVLLEEGSRLVVLRSPWGLSGTGEPIGALVHPSGRIGLAGGQPRIRITVTNTSTRPVRVSSHHPFWRLNRRLEFDREAARGYRLDVPAGGSVRFAPGETRDVDLVAYAVAEGST